MKAFDIGVMLKNRLIIRTIRWEKVRDEFVLIFGDSGDGDGIEGLFERGCEYTTIYNYIIITYIIITYIITERTSDELRIEI